MTATRVPEDGQMSDSAGQMLTESAAENQRAAVEGGPPDGNASRYARAERASAQPDGVSGHCPKDLKVRLVGAHALARDSMIPLE
jgi:hypothetical protein